jgi:hypothetical protein
VIDQVRRLKLAAFVMALAAPSAAFAEDNLEYAVVSGVETFQRLKGEDNLYPWDKAGPDEIIISNSCGFARMAYYKVTTPGFSRFSDEQNLKRWDALVQLGEWCEIKEFIFDHLTLVAYRQWKGKNYIVSYADIMVGEDHRLYAVDNLFIDATGLGRLVVPVEGLSGDHCAPGVKECSEHRLYLDSLFTFASQ